MTWIKGSEKLSKMHACDEQDINAWIGRVGCRKKYEPRNNNIGKYSICIIDTKGRQLQKITRANNLVVSSVF